MDTKTLIPACLSLRCSDPRQDTSIEQQREQLTEFFKDKYRIVCEYVDEGKSGSKASKIEKREDFMRMIGKAPTAEWQTILCVDMSRFGRLDNIDGADAKKKLRAAGKKLVTMLEGEINWRTGMGRMMDALLTEAKHAYSTDLGQKCLKGKRDTFRKRRPFGFRVPYGMGRKIIDNLGVTRTYHRQERFRCPKNWKQCLIPGEAAEQDVVVSLFNDFDTRDVGFRWLAAQLNEQGIPSPEGHLWCDKIVQQILENEKYCGDMRLGESGDGEFWRLDGDKIVPAETTKHERKANYLVEFDTHEGIVSRQLYEAVQAKMALRRRTGSRPQKDGGYPLTGVLFCGVCGKKMYGNPNKSAKKSGRTKYVCKQAIKYGAQCDCSQWSVEEQVVLPFMVDKLVKGIDRKLVVQAREKPPAHKTSKDTNDLQRRLDQLAREVEQGEKNLLLAPPALFASLAAHLASWQEERERLQGELDAAQKTSSPNWTDTLQKRREWLQTVRGRLVEITFGKTLEGKKPQYTASVFLPPDALRQLFTANGAQVHLWWSKVGRRWEVCRARVRLFGQEVAAPFASDCSLMVWCGVRNGRRFISGSSAVSRPMAL